MDRLSNHIQITWLNDQTLGYSHPILCNPSDLLETSAAAHPIRRTAYFSVTVSSTGTVLARLPGV